MENTSTSFSTRKRLVVSIIILLFLFLFLTFIFAETTTSNTKQTKNNSTMLKLWMPGADPDGVIPNVLTDIMFSVFMSGLVDSPDDIQLEEINADGRLVRIIGKLKDNGKNGDLSAGDYIYSGTFSIKSESEGKLYYRVTVEYAGQMYSSKINMLTVTNFPIVPAPSDPDFIITDPRTGQKFYSNELIIGFTDGISPERIREIISAEKASAVGTIPAIGVFQLHISNKGTPEGVYKSIKTFQAYEEVEYAEPNYISELDNTNLGTEHLTIEIPKLF